jgi:putative PIN family toxin of toxin-antitoxin system
MSAVLDTNVLALGFVRPEPAPDQLLAAWRTGVYQLLVSDHLLGELARTFTEAYFSRHLSPQQRANNLALLHDQATRVAITAQVRRVATHPEDDLVLATAVSGKAQYLVTGDRKLQELGSYQGVTIVSPRAFVDTLQAARNEDA